MGNTSATGGPLTPDMLVGVVATDEQGNYLVDSDGNYLLLPQEVIATDAEGNIIAGEDGQPITSFATGVDDDPDFDAMFQGLVASVSGLPGELVRPRWQPNPPKRPEYYTNWAAVGVTEVIADAGPAILHDGASNAGQGWDEYQRHEDLMVLVSFYGPQSHRKAYRLRDGLCIPQNLEQMIQQRVAFVDTGPIRAAPELYNQVWTRRHDIELRFRRKAVRNYEILNILSADPYFKHRKIMS